MSAVDKFLEDVSGRHARFYFAAVHELFVATVRGDRTTASAARSDLARVTRETQGAAEIMGASIALRAAARAMTRPEAAAFCREPGALIAFAADEQTQTLIPRVTFDEALADMVERTPVTIRNAAQRTALQIAKLYGAGTNVAFARASTEAVTKAAQQFIATTFRSGIDEGEAGRRLAMTVNEIRDATQAWSEGYARMVFRTNVNTAVTAGRFRQSRDPDVRAAVPAFRFDAVGDSDTRDNHGAADGMILSVDNPAWNNIAPPLGYNCRCQVSHVTRFELEAEGRIDDAGRVIEDRVPADAFPDEGFRHGGRPDLFLGGT